MNTKIYRLLEVKFNKEYKKIMEGLVLEEITSLKEGKTNDIILECTQKNNDDYFMVYGIKKDGPVLHIEHCQHGSIKDMDIAFMNSLQILLLRYNSVSEGYYKKVILMNGFGKMCNDSLAYSDILKNRFIVERNFDPDSFDTSGFLMNWNCVLGYFSDKLNINVIRKNNMYELRIFRSDWKYQKKFLNSANEIIEIENKMEQASRLCQTIALYSCYSKAREALLNIVKEIEDCDIFGYMPNSYTYNNFRYYNNDTIIKAYKLQKIM